MEKGKIIDSNTRMFEALIKMCIRDSIEDDSVVGVAWGRTLNVLIRHLPKMSRSNTLTIQLNGGASRALYESGATDIVKAFKNAIGGDGYLLPAPAIVDTPVSYTHLDARARAGSGVCWACLCRSG